MMESFGDLMGYVPDFYVMVDLQAFAALVDAVGGVYYDVPVNMYYNDPAQDLYINISAGEQLLNGEDALKVVRFRSGYATADIGRIDTQQDFLKTAAEQVLANKDSLKITSLVDIFLNYVETDLTYGNLIWFAQEFYKMDSENIRFHTLPANYWDSINGASYVTIYANEWLELINEYLNPYDEDITMDALSVLTRNASGYLYSTDGVYAGSSSWGSGYTSSSEPDEDEEDETESTDDPENPEDPTDDPSGTDTPVAGPGGETTTPGGETTTPPEGETGGETTTPGGETTTPETPADPSAPGTGEGTGEPITPPDTGDIGGDELFPELG